MGPLMLVQIRHVLVGALPIALLTAVTELGSAPHAVLMVHFAPACRASMHGVRVVP